MRAVGIIFILLFGKSICGFSQIKKDYEFLERKETFCSSHFATYSDSSFILNRGCECHQSIQVGFYEFSKDTFYLHPIKLDFDNLIDSITFFQDTISTDTIDIISFDKNGIALNDLNDFIFLTAGLDSMELDEIWNYDWKRNLIKFYYRNEPFFQEINGITKEIEPTTYILDKNNDYSLGLGDLSILMGQLEHITIPENTNKIHIHYSLVLDLMIIPILCTISLNHQYNQEIIKFEEYTIILE